MRADRQQQDVLQFRRQNRAARGQSVAGAAGRRRDNHTISGEERAEMIGGMRVDDILTIGKERLQELIRAKAQGLLDQYRSGLQLVGINLNKVYPPEDVAEAFRDVSNANQDREKRINDALGYRNTVIPQARGEAARVIQEAEGYKIAAINKAGGEAGRFEQMLTEYEMDRQKDTPDVTATRLYLESMEKVLAKVKKYVVDPKKGGTLNLRLLQKE